MLVNVTEKGYILGGGNNCTNINEWKVKVEPCTWEGLLFMGILDKTENKKKHFNNEEINQSSPLMSVPP